MGILSPPPTKTQASGVFWFLAPAPCIPALQFPAPCPPARPLPHRPLPAPSRQLQLSGQVTQPPFFLCSLAMRSSSWRGPSGRARRRSRRGWRGCGGRNRRTWSWPSRSARLTCPLPRLGSPSTCTGGSRMAVGAGFRKEKTPKPVYTPTHSHSVVPISRCDMSQPLLGQGLAGQKALGSLSW